MIKSSWAVFIAGMGHHLAPDGENTPSKTPHINSYSIKSSLMKDEFKGRCKEVLSNKMKQVVSSEHTV